MISIDCSLPDAKQAQGFLSFFKTLPHVSPLFVLVLHSLFFLYD